jgi:hypothetical protein
VSNKLQLFLTPHVQYTPFIVVKDFWSSKVLDQFWKVLWIFKVYFTYFRVWVFLNVANRSLSSLIFSHQFFNIILVLLIVLCKIDFFLNNRCSLWKVLNQNLNLKFYQMDCWFEFLDIHIFLQSWLFLRPIWHPFWLILLWQYPLKL